MRKTQVNRPTEKAYNNVEFLNSPDGRIIRIVSEFLEPARRFRHQGIKDTIVFFGSARVKSRKESLAEFKRIEKAAKQSNRLSKRLERELSNAEVDLHNSKYYEDAAELARRLTIWSKRRYRQNRFVVCSGGGPGIMEAANKGAKLAGGRSIGLNISLPFEQSSNRFVSKELNFEFHYFFMRKFWFVYLAKGMVMFPGGFGTLDELMEVLTLLQTQKIRKRMSVILYDREYWRKILNFDALVRHHVISASDLKLFSFANTPQEAFERLTHDLERMYPDDI